MRVLVECDSDDESRRQTSLMVRDGAFSELREYTPQGLALVFSPILKRRLSVGL